MIIPSVALLLMALSCLCSCLPHASSSAAAFPACAGSQAPVMLGTSTLSFCDMISGVSCCDTAEDEVLREQFQGMNVLDAACATIVKDTLCSRCMPSTSVHGPFNTPGSTTAKSIPPRCTSSSSAGSPQQDAMCLESISAGSYLNMAAHPDGSGRVFFSTRDGKILLASVPASGSGVPLRGGPFLDLTDRVLGLMGVAFHPEFAANGRFFVSYNCDTSASPTCISSAAAAGTGNVSSPFQYQLVVAEFMAESMATRADPSEVRRIFTMGLPQRYTTYTYQQHGGQILFHFHPTDGFLYLIIGNGEINEHRFDFDKNNISFLGNIVRFNVDSVQGQSGGASSPTNSSDSPTTKINAEIFAIGLSDPRGCSFDSEKPSYFYCANVDEQRHESVLLISRGGNYSGPSVNAAAHIVGYDPPVTGNMSSIVGGLVYRGFTDPSLQGRYLYMYGTAAWAAVETPASSGRYASVEIPNIWCSTSSPLPCTGGGIGGQVVSLGVDNSKDAYALATDGVYRIVARGLCGGPPDHSSSGFAWMWSFMAFAAMFLIYLLWTYLFPAAGEQRACCNGWFSCCASIICTCCNTVTNINGPSASSNQGLQLG